MPSLTALSAFVARLDISFDEVTPTWRGAPDSRLRRCWAGAFLHGAPEGPVIRTGTTTSARRALSGSCRLQITPDFA